MEKIAAKFELKRDSIREEKGEGGDFAYFEGYASTFGNIDRTDDIVMRGAFKRSLEENKTVKMLWQHRFDAVIGQFPELKEDDKGLFVKGRINLGTEKGREAIALLRAGDIDSMSIGYQVLKDVWNGDLNVRMLQELKLFEISLVTEPANELARITGVKTVVPYQNLPLADETEEWDASAANGRVREFTDSTDSPSMSYRKAFLWYDGGEPDKFGSYKLQIADVVDGKLEAIPRGVFAAAAAIQGARGGVDLPEGDVAGVKANIEKYYEKMGRTAPWVSKSNIDDIETIPDAETWLKTEKLFSCKEAKRFISMMKAVILRERDAVEGSDLKERDAVDDLSKLEEATKMLLSIKETLLRGNDNVKGRSKVRPGDDHGRGEPAPGNCRS